MGIENPRQRRERIELYQSMTPTTPQQPESETTLSEFEYKGGGYCRQKGVPKGTKAEIIHATELLKRAQASETELNEAKEELKNTLSNWIHDRNHIQEQLATALKERDEAMEYAKHDFTCETSSTGMDIDCTCGLTALRTRYDAAQKPKPQT